MSTLYGRFLQNVAIFKIWAKDGHGKSINGHGKVMEKYFVKSVGTLFIQLNRNHYP